MNIPLKRWGRGDHITAADLNRLTEAIKRATPVQGPGISVSQSLGGSVISLSRRAGAGGGSAQADEDFPFRIRRVNSGTSASPSWHTLVYIPDYAITARFGISPSGMSQYDSSNMPYWYEFTNTIGGLGPVCLHVRVVNAGTTACYWRLGGLSASPDWPTGEGVAILRTYVIPLGVVSGTGKGEVVQLVSSAVYVPVDFLGSDGGGGGSFVVVDDERSDDSAPGIVGYGGVSQDGAETLIVMDGIGPDVVFFKNGDTAIGDLLDYLAGRLDFEDDAAFVGLGKNVNTETFADDCLGPAETPDADSEDADPNKAAPSAHTHSLGQITNDDGTELDAQSIIDWFSNAGMWDALGETGPSGEPPSEDSLLTIGDIEYDPSYYQPDSATPSAGSVTTDLLALSGHRHPLNVADVQGATGPTGETPTPPPADGYILPVGVGTVGSGQSETDSPETAMHGEMPFYARVDHVHPICVEMGPTGLVTSGEVGPNGGMALPHADNGDFGPTGAPSGITLDQHTWTPGAQGYVESYCTRIVNGPDGFTKYAIFRRRKVSRTGAVVWVGPEYVGFALAG